MRAPHAPHTGSSAAALTEVEAHVQDEDAVDRPVDGQEERWRLARRAARREVARIGAGDLAEGVEDAAERDEEHVDDQADVDEACHTPTPNARRGTPSRRDAELPERETWRDAKALRSSGVCC